MSSSSRSKPPVLLLAIHVDRRKIPEISMPSSAISNKGIVAGISSGSQSAWVLCMLILLAQCARCQAPRAFARRLCFECKAGMYLQVVEVRPQTFHTLLLKMMGLVCRRCNLSGPHFHTTQHHCSAQASESPKPKRTLHAQPRPVQS